MEELLPKSKSCRKSLSSAAKTPNNTVISSTPFKEAARKSPFFSEKKILPAANMEENHLANHLTNEDKNEIYTSNGKEDQLDSEKNKTENNRHEREEADLDSGKEGLSEPSLMQQSSFETPLKRTSADLIEESTPIEDEMKRFKEGNSLNHSSSFINSKPPPPRRARLFTALEVWKYTDDHLQNLKDVQLISNEGDMLYAHSFVLACQSQVFKEKIEDYEAPSIDGNYLIRCIEKIDHCTETIEIFLDYFYKGDTCYNSLSPSNVFKVKELSNDYAIPELTDICNLFVDKNKETQCLSLLVYCPLSSSDYIFEYAARHFMSLNENEIQHLSFERLKKVIDNKSLRIDRETFFLKMLLEWVSGHANENSESEIENLFKSHISFARVLVESSSDEIASLSNHPTFKGLEKLWIKGYQDRDKVLNEQWSMQLLEPVLPRRQWSKIQLMIDKLDEDILESKVWTAKKLIKGVVWELFVSVSISQSFWRGDKRTLVATLEKNQSSKLVEKDWLCEYKVVNIVDNGKSCVLPPIRCPHAEEITLIDMEKFKTSKNTMYGNGFVMLECTIFENTY